MATSIAFNERKFDELVLYVAQKSLDDPKYGAVKLNKILFFSDFFAFAKLGQPITGATYQRLPQGPCAREMKPRQRALEQQGDAVDVPRPAGMHTQKRFTALRAPDLNVFSAAEIALVDDVLRALGPHNAKTSSHIAHQVTAWKLAFDGETIPYAAAVIPRRPLPLSSLEIDHGKKIAASIKP